MSPEARLPAGLKVFWTQLPQLSWFLRSLSFACSDSAAKQWQQAEFARGPSGTDVETHVLCRWAVWRCSCVSSLSLFTIISPKMEDADMSVPQCCVVPAGCTCQIARRAGPLWPLPGMEHQLSLGFLHLHATCKCQVDSFFHPKGIPGYVHCLEPWQGWWIHWAEGSAVSGTLRVVWDARTRTFAIFMG